MVHKKNAKEKEERLLKRLKEAMYERGYSLRDLGRELGISKSGAQLLLDKKHYPTRKNREEMNGKIKRLVLEFENRGNKIEDDKTFEGGEIMEQLMEETLAKFGLKRDPFLNEIKGAQDLYLLPETGKAYKFMERVARLQGFGAVIGEVGCGKTLLLRKLIEDMGDRVKFVQTQHTNKGQLRFNHILDAIYFDLTGKKTGFSGRSAELKARTVFDLLDMSMQKNERVCLVIDDAHQLPMETLRNLKQLYDYVGFQRRLGILLLGQLELIKAMRDPRLRETTQRCAYYFMRGLVHPGSLAKYLEFKVKKAGGDASRIFAKEAYKLIQKNVTFLWSGNNGNKIRICPLLRTQNLAALLMNEAVRLGEDRVTKDVIGEVLGS